MKARFLNLLVGLFLTATYAVAQQPTISNYYPLGKDRVSKFETPKLDSTVFNGVKVRIGGAFTQQFQMLNHTNTHTIGVDNGDILTQDDNLYLMSIKNGFNNANANLNIDVQLADGVRMELVTYLSSLHHTEAWVKGGFIQFDKLPFINSSAVNNIMDYTTIKIGHMEINYGDGHFRRSDNGNAILNPFVGNYIMDAFDTQIGGELIFNYNGFLAVASVTEGEIKGSSAGTNEDAGLAYIGKIGYDNYISDDFRLRLTASLFHTKDYANRNNLYSGDRTGTRYQNVLGTVGNGSDFRAGRFNPGFSKEVTSIMLNPYVQFGGLEFFGMFETSSGYGTTNPDDSRNVKQMSGELIYRFGNNDSFYVGTRLNKVFGELEAKDVTDPSIMRTQITAGWFLTKNVLAKFEYVQQKYNDFSAGTANEGAKFDGFMFEAVVGF